MRRHGPRHPPRPPGLELRELAEAFQHAHLNLVDAQARLEVAAEAARTAECPAPFVAGEDLARRRCDRRADERRLALARLLDGRCSSEIPWLLPDDE